VMKSLQHALNEAMRYVPNEITSEFADIYSYVKSWSRQLEAIPMLARYEDGACSSRSSL
jgi:hypothetical protein